MLKKKIFGLDISDHSIEALVLTKPFFGKAKVTAYARTILRGEVVKNGVIKNQKKLEEAITKLLASAQPAPIKTPYCIMSLPESQVFTTIFKLPAGLKHKEVKNTIPYKAEEIIPFKTSEVYFDFKTLTKMDETQEVFYVAVPSDVVDGYVNTLNNIGLRPVAFDLESISLARALLGEKTKPGKAKLLIDIGSRTTNLNIYDRNGIRQSLTIKIAGDRFTKAIAQKMGIPERQAEELKRKNGFDPTKQKGKVLLVLQNEFKRIIAEAKKLIEFYQVNSQRQIDELILVGGSSLLPKVDQYLADNTSLQTNLGNPLKKVTDPKNLAKLKVNATLFSNVAGLAIRGLAKDPVYGDINLLPTPPAGFKVVPDKSDKKSWLWIYIRLGVLIFLLIVLGALYKLKLNNFDVYQKVYPTPTFDSSYQLDIDFAVLDEIRGLLNATSASTSTGTTTQGLLEEGEETFAITIKQTSVGYLNVRKGPSTSFEKIAQVDSGKEFTVISEEESWYEIEFDDGSTGWVYSIYVDKLE